MATLAGPDELDREAQAAVEAVLFPLADEEYVLAERYTEWQVIAPTLESDIALSNIAQDELGHARLWYDLLGEFGYTESELLFERDPTDFAHATLVELPFSEGDHRKSIWEGDWADAIVRGYLYDIAEQLRLSALSESAYAPIADRTETVLQEEQYHRDHAERWLERLCESEGGKERVQNAVDRLFPYSLALFEPTEYEDEITGRAIRSRSLSELCEEWRKIIVPFLESLGVQVPTEVDPPDVTGRNGEHTEQWPELYEEMTHTYRTLQRSDAHRIMGREDQ